MAPTSNYQLTFSLFLLALLGLVGCGDGQGPQKNLPKNQTTAAGKTTTPILTNLELEDTLASRQTIFVQGFIHGSYPDPFAISGQAVVAPLAPGAPEVFLLRGQLKADSTLSIYFASLGQAGHNFRIEGQLVNQKLVTGQLIADSVANRGERETEPIPVSLESEKTEEPKTSAETKESNQNAPPKESKRQTHLKLTAEFLSKQLRELKEKQTLVIGVEQPALAPTKNSAAQLPNTKEYKLVFDIGRKKDGTAYLRGFFVAGDKADHPAIQYFPLASSLTIKSQVAADLYQLVKSSTEVLDLNLDGYLDISLLTKQVNSQETYHYFVYHPQAQVFMDWGTHINPQMDEVGGTLTSFAKLSLDNREYVQVTSRLENGLFRPFEVQETKLNQKADSIAYYLRRPPGFEPILEKKLFLRDKE